MLRRAVTEKKMAKGQIMMGDHKAAPAYRWRCAGACACSGISTRAAR